MVADTRPWQDFQFIWQNVESCPVIRKIGTASAMLLPRARHSFIGLQLSIAPTCVCILVTQLCPTLWDPMDCSPPGSSVHGILQAGILQWVGISFSTTAPISFHKNLPYPFTHYFWLLKNQSYNYCPLKSCFAVGRTSASVHEEVTAIGIAFLLQLTKKPDKISKKLFSDIR